MATIECADKTAGQAALLEFFGLREQPFGVTPDPRFLYLTASHREALASLIYAIDTKRGFSALVAEPGMGKTTLLFYLLDKLKSSARTAFLFRPDNNTRELLQSLLLDLGLDANPESIPQMHELLNSVLLEDLRAGKHFVWVIDEAQDLDSELLEFVRLLSNFETPLTKLMHIVLAGQPGLADKLARPELLQLRQRVSTLTHLAPLSPRETSDYIQYRTRWAGCRNGDLFSPESRTLIAQESLGIPRNINNLCFACLSLGFVEGRREIDLEIVHKVLADRALEIPLAKPSPAAFPSSPVWASDFLEQDLAHDFSNPASPRSHLWTGIAIFGFLIIPLLLVILESNARGGVLEALEGPIAEDIVTRVTGYDAHLPSLPDMHPAALQPPKPPIPLPVSENPQPPSQSSTDDFEEVTKSRDLSLRQSKFISPPQHAKHGATGPRVVYTQEGENLFQLALEYYGKANWTIVAKIRSQNPQIRDAFTVFHGRQRVVLPDLTPEYPWSDKAVRGW